jgi:hypothetical protein
MKQREREEKIRRENPTQEKEKPNEHLGTDLLDVVFGIICLTGFHQQGELSRSWKGISGSE